jgi:hypothetical protein
MSQTIMNEKIKKYSMILFFVFGYISMIIGVHRILSEIFPYSFYFKEPGDIQGLVALAVIIGFSYFLYMGFLANKYKHRLIPGCEGFIDRDRLLYFLEKEFKLTNKLKNEIPNNSVALYIKMLKELQGIIDMYEEAIRKGDIQDPDKEFYIHS